MFQDYNSPVLGFSSIPPSRGKNETTGTQTTEKRSNDSETQTTTYTTIQTQTNTTIQQLAPQYDEQRLALFLNKIEEAVKQELALPLRQLDSVQAKEDKTTFSRITSYPYHESKRKVSCVSWNCRGGSLAVGHAVIKHERSCNHEGSIAVHVISGGDPLEGSRLQPRLHLVSTCVSCLQFHPNNPSLLAAGLYGGGVLVWDLSQEDEWVARENSAQHIGKVVHIEWNHQSDDHFLSAGGDGCIFLRKLRRSDGIITTMQKYVISRGHMLPERSGSQEGLEVFAMAAVNGDDEYVVGVGGGAVLHCLLPSSTTVMSGQGQGETDPVTLTYQPHRALVTAIKTQTALHIFAVASTDGKIRIFKTLQVEPVIVLNKKHVILDLFWADKQAVIGICGWNNTVTFIRTSNGAEMIPSKMELRENQVAIVAQPSPNRRAVAVGGVNGTVDVWHVTWE